ncbi:MAG: hypothetical protein FD156_1048 [Nitrospirae bacterium]|nr:MAG: hypothetical protein FD156_1048 [Nitrospirota bacterium]
MKLFNRAGYSIYAQFRCAPRLLPAFILFFIFWLNLPAHALDVPKVQGYVNDYADMISPTAKAALENELKAFEQTDSTQIVILTVPSLEGEVIEDFGIKVAESWKIGQKGKDNGVIFLVSKQDKKIRIEVGRGLEGPLTDLAAGRIIDIVIKPRFKRGDFDGGFLAGVSSLIDAARGEFKADGNHRPQKHEKSSRFFTFLMFGAFVMLFLGSISRVFGGVSGAVGLPAIIHLTLLPLSLTTFIIFAAVGLGAGIFLPILFSSGGQHRGGGFWPGGGYYGGGSGFSSGGSDFGGFSGGGGGFGGGGASGDW